MRLLVTTQIVDKNDTGLGFMHEWIQLLSERFEFVTVICLKKGVCEFGDNVTVFSLGKEQRVSRFEYLRRFYTLVIRERHRYDAVFVHMNQEYVLLAGLIWKMFGKKIVLWYNHTIGTMLTRSAFALSDSVLFTSSYSYGAVQKIKNARQVGAGIDTDYFSPNTDSRTSENARKILFLGRISPVKKVLEFAQALGKLHSRGINFKATICGDLGSPSDATYRDEVEKVLQNCVDDGVVTLVGGVTHDKTKELYLGHDFYVNLTQTGSFDKTVLEAMALERFVIVHNQSFETVLSPRALVRSVDRDQVADVIESALNLTEDELVGEGRQNRDFVVKNHSLKALIATLEGVLKSD